MNRRTLGLAVALLLAGLAPATAIIGFCARMPCCHHASGQSALTSERTDCCTTIACYESPSATLSAAGVSPDVIAAATAPAIATVVSPMPDRGQAPSEPSPPPRASERLAVLSTLII